MHLIFQIPYKKISQIEDFEYWIYLCTFLIVCTHYFFQEHIKKKKKS